MYQRTMSDLPYHLVVGMPALSPTMEVGTISEWKFKEGDSFVAGDSLAEIETDKATIDFEAQDDGVVAKLLVEAGTNEIPVNMPIMVTVEEEGDVAAFKDFVVESSDANTTNDTDTTPPPPPVVEASPPPPVPEPVVTTPPPSTPIITPVAATMDDSTPPPLHVHAEVTTSSSTNTMSPIWGTMAKTSSPIAKLMTSTQKKYLEKYGSTGQVPL